VGELDRTAGIRSGSGILGRALRDRNSVSTTVQKQSTALRQPVFIQGGILFYFGHQLKLLVNDKITIKVEQGLEVELLSPSTIEFYTILLAVRLMKYSRNKEVIHTDYVEATKISFGSNLRNLGWKANLPKYETRTCGTDANSMTVHAGVLQ